MPRKTETIRDAIRRRVADENLNPFRLAALTDGAVSHYQLRRFLAGTHDLTSAKADALLRVLGLRLAKT